MLSLNTIHYLRPYWSAREWGITFDELRGKHERGSGVEFLENRIKQITGMEYAIALNSGRSGIKLALDSYRFPRGSEVIVPSFCCSVVIAAVIQAGLEPVLADVDEDFNLSAASVEEALSLRTRAVIVPHLSGKWAESMDTILAMAQHHEYKVIDDACPAFGLRKNGQWAGTFGDVGVFSFGAGKPLFGPGGGILVTNDSRVIGYCKRRVFQDENKLSVRLRLGRFIWRYGWQHWTYPVSVGLDALHYQILQPLIRSGSRVPSFTVCRMAEVDARLAIEQLEKCDEILFRMRKNALRLLHVPALKYAGLRLPKPTNHVFNKLLVCVDGLQQQKRTDEIRQHLLNEGIETERSYKPLHFFPAFQHYRHTALPVTERLWEGAFSIPNNPGLTEAELYRLEAALGQALSRMTGARSSSSVVTAQ